MLETKEPLAKPPSTANWCTSTKANRLSKFIPAQDLINMGMHISASTVNVSSHTVFPAVVLKVQNAAISHFETSLYFHVSHLATHYVRRKTKYPPLRRAAVQWRWQPSRFPHLKHISITPQWAFSLAPQSGNSFVSPLPWHFPCYDNEKKSRASAMLVQKPFTRDVTDVILTPCTEDISKLLEVGTLGIKWIKIIRQHVRSILHYVSLRQLSPSHLHSRQVTWQNSVLAPL